MKRQFAALLFACIATLTACGGGGYGGGSTTPPSNSGSANTPPPGGVASDTIGIALPTGMGTVSTSFGAIGGYTQTAYSQVLAFPPGTTVTIKNLSSSTAHTLNVLSTTGFPTAPALSTSAAGGSALAMGFQSGSIAPGGTVSVTLANPGTYFIGCAYHYLSNGMRDILQVSSSATPGPQATPPASGSTGCSGPYC
jgi:plastocyanin